MGDFPSEIYLDLKRGKEIMHQFSSWDLTEDDIAKLRAFASPAAFGDLDMGENRVDKDVRSALEISDFSFSSSEVLPHIQSHVEDHLMHKNLTFKPYKINIYQEGDFFKPHVDSPTDGSMLGTLVVAFPTPQEGGELIVRHEGYEAMFSFAHGADEPYAATGRSHFFLLDSLMDFSLFYVVLCIF
jgi:predicted 2-oxoglutarate/Fe(II)-dependent dioxygenase YbiX